MKNTPHSYTAKDTDPNTKSQKHKQFFFEPINCIGFSSKSCLFLDRDGVIIKDKHHLCDPELVELCTGAQEVIQTAKRKGWAVVVITNQSGISRGLFSWDDYHRVTKQMLKLLGNEATPTAIYANGYGPHQSHEAWRKPNPGMLLEAAKDLGLDLSQSSIIGDRLSDLRAGANAGLPQLIHVLTGHGHNERPQIEQAIKANDQFSPGTVVRLIGNLKELAEASQLLQ